MISQLAYISSPVYKKHFPGEYHPERPGRLEAIETTLKNTLFWDSLAHISPVKADKNDLLLTHSQQLVEYNLSQSGKNIALDGDTILNEHSIEAALNAAGAGIKAVDLIFKEKKFNKIFAAVRPPGHHAEYNRSMGFCIFNNAAIAAQYAIEKEYVKKILIIDWDVHHGNGTQDIFYSRDDVFYFSMHQWPLYPGTGSSTEQGTGKGEGFTMNKPLAAGCDDLTFQEVLKTGLKEIETNFKPDLIIISAGFDAHIKDPIGGMNISEIGFAKITQIVIDFADTFCGGRIISMLEGGYDLMGLAQCVLFHLKVLSGQNEHI